ncbi:hypothetical protein HY250_01385 [Candidatus Azambacteria bacterium]|nr:hypothetical protein [Candidatus Azambacteria bacterium]
MFFIPHDSLKKHAFALPARARRSALGFARPPYIGQEIFGAGELGGFGTIRHQNLTVAGISKAAAGAVGGLTDRCTADTMPAHPANGFFNESCGMEMIKIPCNIRISYAN